MTLSDTPAWQSVNSPHSWRYYLQGTAEPGGADVPIYAAPARATIEDLRPGSACIHHGIPGRPPTRRGTRLRRRRLILGGAHRGHHYQGAFHMAHVIQAPPSELE